MGLGPMCPFGFSVNSSNAFSQQLEQRAAAIEEGFREGFLQLQLGLRSLHGAVDAALADDPVAATGKLAAGLAELDACNREITAFGEALVRARTELFEREEVDRDDPLIARERFFPTIDYDGVYRELTAHGAALPHQILWDDVASRVRDGGGHAGLRLLDRHLRELQSDLRNFVGEVSVMRRLPGRALAEALHGSSRSVATLFMGFIRLLATLTYFSILCERASELYAQSLVDDLAAAS